MTEQIKIQNLFTSLNDFSSADSFYNFSNSFINFVLHESVVDDTLQQSSEHF
ncbi:hypothetical protein LOZ58_006727 [Ophidiomyces ophidiicola]|nr:hypothetical protein LOZ58_006727 [Ophidiomyces ophidiicola]